MKPKFYKNPEFYFVVYLFLFLFIKLLYKISFLPSTLTLGTCVALVLILFFLNCGNKLRQGFGVWLIFLVTSAIIFSLSYALHKNSFVGQYAENFALYALIPFLFVWNLSDYRKVILYFCIFSCFGGLFLMLDPFANYFLTADYMQFGFGMLFYSFIGMTLLVFYYRKKWFVLPLLSELVLLFWYANKGAFITAVVLFCVFFMLTSRNSLVKSLFLALLFIAAIFWRGVLSELVSMGYSMGVDSYSLTTFQLLLSNNSQMITGQRTEIWLRAWEWIKEYPVFGSGIGTFEVAEGGYAHNIFIDITVTFGFVGFFIFVLLVIWSFVKLRSCNDSAKKHFALAVFLFWFVAMEVSLTFWSTVGFWIYWEVCFTQRKRKNKGRIVNGKTCVLDYCS